MNIVSIDFDIIMAPSIEYYNSLNGDREYIFNEPLMKNCEADLAMYHKLSQWLYKKIKTLPAKDIIFIEDHHKIINHIPENEDVFLVNIDHHHDLGYSQEDYEVTNENLDCGNWGKFLIQNNRIKNYIWLCNPNSSKNTFNYGAYHYLKDFDIDNLVPDKIIICLSPPWVPHQYRNLFFNWMSAISAMKDTNYYLN